MHTLQGLSNKQQVIKPSSRTFSKLEAKLERDITSGMGGASMCTGFSGELHNSGAARHRQHTPLKRQKERDKQKSNKLRKQKKKVSLRLLSSWELGGEAKPEKRREREGRRAAGNGVAAGASRETSPDRDAFISRRSSSSISTTGMEGENYGLSSSHCFTHVADALIQSLTLHERMLFSTAVACPCSCCAKRFKKKNAAHWAMSTLLPVCLVKVLKNDNVSHFKVSPSPQQACMPCCFHPTLARVYVV